ncbi:MAG: hypothetical protein WC958_01365 [Dehalococcoidales bacterium]
MSEFLKKAPELIPILPGYVRQLLWIVLLLLSSAIFLFPVKLKFQYFSVESLYIFGDKLWLFCVLFLLWITVLLILLLTRINEWQRILLIAIFALVFFGFWVVITPYGGWCDGLVNMGHVKYLAQVQEIPFSHDTLAYFQYPGIHLTGFALSEITGIDITQIRTFFLIFCSIIQAIFLYLLFNRLLKNKQAASLAVIFLICGALLITRTVFHPAVTASVFFVILFYLLTKDNKLDNPPVMVLFILSFVALTITYLPSSLFFIFALSGIYIINRLKKQKTFPITLIIFCMFVFLSWQIFWATRMFGDLTAHIEDFIAAFNNPLERLMPIFGTASQSLAADTPLWAGLTRYFWLAALYLLGIILALRNAFKIKKLDFNETVETGALWGILIASLIAILAFGEGTQWHRILVYAPYLIAPIIIRALYKVPDILYRGKITCTQNYMPLLLSALLILIALPTFLVNHASINTQSIYKYELRSGEFVANNFNQNELLFISDGVTVYSFAFYIPDAVLAHPAQPWDINSEKELWASIQEKSEQFQNSSATALFALTERFDQSYRDVFDIDKTSKEWLGLIWELESNNLIYNNGHAKIYKNLTLN